MSYIVEVALGRPVEHATLVFQESHVPADMQEGSHRQGGPGGQIRQGAGPRGWEGNVVGITEWGSGSLWLRWVWGSWGGLPYLQRVRVALLHQIDVVIVDHVWKQDRQSGKEWGEQ